MTYESPDRIIRSVSVFWEEIGSVWFPGHGDGLPELGLDTGTLELGLQDPDLSAVLEIEEICEAGTDKLAAAEGADDAVDAIRMVEPGLELGYNAVGKHNKRR